MHRGSPAFHIRPVSPRIAATVALVVSACGTASLLGACKADEARLSVAVQPMSSPLNTADVRYRIDIGDRRWQFTLPATASPAGGRRTSGEFETPRSGTARVAFTVVLPDGREVASGAAFAPGTIQAVRRAESAERNVTVRSFRWSDGSGRFTARAPGWKTNERSMSRTPMHAAT